MFRFLEQLYAIPNQKAIVSKLNEFLSSKFLATTGEAWPTVESKVVEQCQFTPTTIGISQHSGRKLITPKTIEIKKLIAFLGSSCIINSLCKSWCLLVMFQVLLAQLVRVVC